MKKFDYKVGDVFGKLKIIADLGEIHYVQNVTCQCECGKIFNTRFYRVLSRKIKSCGCTLTRSKETRRLLSIQKLKEKNPMWKGEEVGYKGLHEFIRRRLYKPDKCPDCKKEPPRDLANISQQYKRDLSDWEWLCRKCHMIKDGRLEKLRLIGKRSKK